MTGGEELAETIERSITDASHFLVVVSIDALGSQWVPQEIAIALQQNCKIIPVVMPGINQAHLKLLDLDTLIHIAVKDTPTRFDDAIPEVCTALMYRQ